MFVFDGIAMTLLRDLRCRGGRLWVPMALAAALLVGCGGGTSQVEAFKPNRLIVFGDEDSVLVDDGQANAFKYSLNGVDSTDSLRKCLLLPIWTQSMASHYGFVFAACNPNNATPQAFMRARVGATVDDPALGLAQQIADQPGLGAGDLATVLIGGNDLFELFGAVRAGTLTAADAEAAAQQRGRHAADQVNAILATGARAIVATTPDVSLAPEVVAADKLDPGAAALMSRLVYAFNSRLRTGIDSTRFDGRNYGLVLADDMVQVMVKAPASFVLTNVVDAVCLAASARDCTSAAADLVAGGTSSTHLWADARHLSTPGQSRLASQALARAVGNPF